MTKVLSLQQLRRALQQSDQKVFIFESEAQPGYDCENAVCIRMFCWFSEVWPQTKTIVLKSNNGELCFRGVDHIVLNTSASDGQTGYTIYCGDKFSKAGARSFTLSEFR